MERSPPGHSDAGGFEHAQMRFLALATSDDAWFDARASGETAVLLRAEAVRSWELFRTGVIREMNWPVPSTTS